MDIHKSLDEISDEEWDYTFRLNVGAYFYLAKPTLPSMHAGSSIIGPPAERAPIYALPARDDASYISGARVAATGGRPIA